MADREDKNEETIDGKFYVDSQCIDCDLCRETAPNNFKRSDDEGYSYVYKQPENEEEVCEMKEPIMADDGSGSDISIPSFLMFKEDVDPIREALKNNELVRIEMTWKIPTPDDRVEFDPLG